LRVPALDACTGTTSSVVNREGERGERRGREKGERERERREKEEATATHDATNRIVFENKVALEAALANPSHE
jgi:hypothetical protein